VARHIAAGHRIFLDARESIGRHFPDRFPGITARCRAAGIDPATMPIPVRPAAHFHMGGIAVDAQGRSTVDGLWACGEVAATGLHGANRLASNSLLEAAVMAETVAESIAATEARALLRTRPVELPAAADASAIRSMADETLGVVRDGAGLEKASRALEPLAFANGASADPALVALLIAIAARRRRESRGGHWRRDFPQRSRHGAHRQLVELDLSTNRILSTWSSVDDRPLPAHAHA
jgi:L-aspartate oxidase